MQVVIEIPEYVKQDFDRATEDDIHGCYYDYNGIIGRAIQNGVPLPKGHGRLIDVKQIVTEDECIWNSDGSCTTITTYDIDSTPTIIEADKAERREKT